MPYSLNNVKITGIFKHCNGFVLSSSSFIFDFDLTISFCTVHKTNSFIEFSVLIAMFKSNDDCLSSDVKDELRKIWK